LEHFFILLICGLEAYARYKLEKGGKKPSPIFRKQMANELTYPQILIKAVLERHTGRLVGEFHEVVIFVEPQ
jgi:hypothetical protein